MKRRSYREPKFDFKFKRIALRGMDCFDWEWFWIILYSIAATIAVYGIGFYFGKNISPAYYVCIPFGVILNILSIHLIFETFFKIEYYTPREVYEREKEREKKRGKTDEPK